MNISLSGSYRFGSVDEDFSGDFERNVNLRIFVGEGSSISVKLR